MKLNNYIVNATWQ